MAGYRVAPPDPTRVPFDAIDAASVGEFADWLARVVTRCGDDVVLDLAGVGFLQAVGIQVLVDVERSLAATGRSLHLHDPRPVVRRVLDVCNLTGRWLVGSPGPLVPRSDPGPQRATTTGPQTRSAGGG